MHSMHACETGVTENVPAATVFGVVSNCVPSSNRIDAPPFTHVPVSLGCTLKPALRFIKSQKLCVTLGRTATSSAASDPVLGRAV